ncbi:SulP family inorganic anion transporter [Luteimicrobium subarcticum]|uniref:MFS superfamily sulfate permease-like transporter n=1 Tax=Luteimicrobium subarcticum TaxID=620910 RepID=A0A2M8WJJ8_9MICO|nr:SulP family inorganic anion transporter [Luteimicrobium subarcticum]PJI91110.1 MFS superfamily sulfate permease-like transporter [Luteimicrobium subarcticum]
MQDDADPAGRSAGRATARRWPLLRTLQGYRRDWLRPDLFAALTLTAIAVPEQMATATLAGFPVQFGLYVILMGGLAIALFGSSRQLSVGADSVITGTFAAQIGAIATFGSDEYRGLVVVLSFVVGVLLVLVGLARVSWVADFLSTPVMTGFLAGIGITIVVGQVPGMLDLPKASGGPVEQLVDVGRHLGDASWTAAAVAAASIVVIVACSRFGPRFPGVFVALVLSIAAVAVLGLDVDVLGKVPAGLPALDLPPLSFSAARDVLTSAVTVAFVCVIQTAAASRSFAALGGYEVDLNRDFMAVGAGSLASSAVGAFPVNTSPPRTALVAESGGRTQLVSLVSVGVVVLILLFATGLLTDLPSATLAAVLAYVGTRIVRIQDLRAIGRFSRRELGLALFTLVVVAFVGVAVGVLVAVVLAVFEQSWNSVRARTLVMGRLGDTPIWVPASPDRDDVHQVDGVVVLALSAPVYFANAAAFRHTLLAAGDRPGVHGVVIDAEAITSIDFTGAAAARTAIAELARRGVRVVVARAVFSHGGAADLGLSDELVFESMDEAVAHLTGTPGTSGSPEPPGSPGSPGAPG